jgi:hypothetical protein
MSLGSGPGHRASRCVFLPVEVPTRAAWRRGPLTQAVAGLAST